MRIISNNRANAPARLMAGVMLTVALLPGINQSQAAEDSRPLVDPRSRWSFSLGIGAIGDTSAPGDYYRFNFDTARGLGEGWTYNFAMNYRLYEFEWKIGNQRFRPQFELPMMLTIVDEAELGMFPDYNAGLMFRWRDWPWNRTIYTTFAIGLGVSYSSKVWTFDRQRHPGEYRAHLKFWLPIELTFAHPKRPQHQIMLFIDHQSGAHITDEGGQDAWGVGYRFGF